MIKEIHYNGFTETPSDYECPDGDLAVSVGLLSEDEALHPILPPSPLFTVPIGYDVVFIHATSAYKHYIVRNTNRFYWINEPAAGSHLTTSSFTSSNLIHTFPSGSQTYQVSAVGNTLIVAEEQLGMHYILWKSSSYSYLGTHIPEMNIRFGLLGRPRFYSLVYGDTFNITFNAMNPASKTFSDENQEKVTSQIMAKLNKFIADTSVYHGRHCFPFFVRYALRLYDGTLTMHSAPILMNPCTTSGPVVTWERLTGSGGSVTEATINMMLVAATLLYKADTTVYDFDNWKDIVKSVDIFISKPIYNYDQNGKIINLRDTDNFETNFIGKLYVHRNNNDDIDYTPNGYPDKSRLMAPFQGGDYVDHIYSEWPYREIYGMYFSGNRTIPQTTVHLPELTAEAQRDTIQQTSTFYFLHSIPIDELSTSVTEIVTPNDYLPSLVAREVMTDDYQSHDSIIPAKLFAYNNRINIADIRREFFNGYHADNMLATCTHVHSYSLETADNGVRVIIDVNELDRSQIYLYTYIKSEGKDIIVQSNDDSHLDLMGFFSRTSPELHHSAFAWFYYPDPAAYKMVLVQNSRLYEIPLIPHDHLNGAYAFIDYGTERNPQSITYPSPTQNIQLLPNKIYTSEVDNPFHFPLLGINTVGTGKILGISSAVRALSEGQFGQFPLYAFSSDGVWALEVSDEGKYTARQPITRDVCINADSITQIDTAVLFATERGIMHISGSVSQCISDTINANGSASFSISSLPRLANVTAQLPLSYVQFNEYIKQCRILYDYKRQRIIVYNQNHAYAYVYSIKSKRWGMMASTIQHAINAYPDAIASIADTYNGEQVNAIVNFSDADDLISHVNGILVTRPIKLDTDALKTVDTIIQRGYFRHGNVRSILYASRDLFNWHLVSSSTDQFLRGFSGTPYKYFRIVLLCNMKADESIFGSTIQFTPRFTNQPR